MAVLRHVGCGLCFRTAAVLTLVSIALAVVMILYTDMRLRSRLDDIANTNTKPENQLEAETSVQTSQDLQGFLNTGADITRFTAHGFHEKQVQKLLEITL